MGRVLVRVVIKVYRNDDVGYAVVVDEGCRLYHVALALLYLEKAKKELMRIEEELSILLFRFQKVRRRRLRRVSTLTFQFYCLDSRKYVVMAEGIHTEVTFNSIV